MKDLQQGEAQLEDWERCVDGKPHRFFFDRRIGRHVCLICDEFLQAGYERDASAKGDRNEHS